MVVKVLLWLFNLIFFPLFLEFHFGSTTKKKKNSIIQVFLAKYLHCISNGRWLLNSEFRKWNLRLHFVEFRIRHKNAFCFFFFVWVISSYSEHLNFSGPFHAMESLAVNTSETKQLSVKWMFLRMKDEQCKAATFFHIHIIGFGAFFGLK